MDLHITDLNHRGSGVARACGQVVYVDGALPGEVVQVVNTAQGKRQGKRRAHYSIRAFVQTSAERTTPRCAHFGVCGGCSLQHLTFEAQIRHFEAHFRQQLTRLAGVEAECWEPALTADPWAYRHRARLGVRYVEKKGGVLIGFRERLSNKIAIIKHCPILAPVLASLLPALRSWIEMLSIKRAIPQLEIAVGEQSCALVLRHLQPLTPKDIETTQLFAQTQRVSVFLQAGGPQSIEILPATQAEPLSYHAAGVHYQFWPWQFTQIHPEVNALMIETISNWLCPEPSDRLLDLYCGLGNFSLPLARRAGSVVGLEASAALVAQARHNAQRNGIENARFEVADLNDPLAIEHVLGSGYGANKAVLDPPRSGAQELLLKWKQPPHEIVYVSCNPATLARDVGFLVQKRKYRLRKVALAALFPQTMHVEVLALLSRR